MSILRSDTQVALNDLHRSLQESADHYRYAADTLQDAAASGACKKIAEERRALAGQAADAIRETGELPGEPDPDREAAEQIRERLEAMIGDDEVSAVVAHRLQGEEELLRILEREVSPVLGDNHSALLVQCRESIAHARRLLGSLGADGG